MQNLSIKNTILTFLVVKIYGIGIGFLIFGIDGDTELIEIVAQTISVSLFVLLISFTIKQSPAQVISAQFFNFPYKNKSRQKLILWLLAAIPFGFFLRLSIGGIWFAWMSILDPIKMSKELNDLLVSTDSPYVWSVLLLGMLIGAMDEEFIYRKFLFGRLAWSIGFFPALLLMSVIFAIPHMNYLSGVIGFVLGLLYVVSGNLWVPIIAHMATNLYFPILESIFKYQDWQLDYELYLLLSYVACFMLIILVGYWIFQLWKRKNNLISRSLDLY